MLFISSAFEQTQNHKAAHQAIRLHRWGWTRCTLITHAYYPFSTIRTIHTMIHRPNAGLPRTATNARG